MFDIFLLVLFIFSLLVASLIIYARWNYGTLEKIPGLKVVKPYFIGGSDPFFYKTPCEVEDWKRVKEYGKMYGYYDGRWPHIFITDPELIRATFVKDFEHFRDRVDWDLGKSIVAESFEFIHYKRWRFVRGLFSPSFTLSKFRNMGQQIINCSMDWAEKLATISNSKTVSKFHPLDFFMEVTSDVATRAFFNVSLEGLEEMKEGYVKYMKNLTMEDIKPHLGFAVSITFPCLQAVLGAGMFESEPVAFLTKMLYKLMDNRRRAGNTGTPDLLDAMNDMAAKCGTDPEYVKLNITHASILGTVITFLMAATEGSPTTLSLACLRLARHHEVQKRAQLEVDEYFRKYHGNMEYKTINELVYVKAVAEETLRMDGLSTRTIRLCVKDWTHEPSGLKIEKGTAVTVPIPPVHYDENNFENPEKFNPDRFLPENRHKINPYAFNPFGHGPHKCFGEKFGIENLVITLAVLIRDFEFKDEYSATLKLHPGRILTRRWDDFELGVMKRTKY